MIAHKDYSQYHFEGQHPDEKILLVLHRFWFDILSQFFLIFAIFLVFVISFIIFPSAFPNFNQGISKNILPFFENVLFMIFWIVSYAIWIDYYFDIWIVTDSRIVNIEQNGLFSREISELKLEKIQDITSDIKGIIPTLLNYGDLQVQTAAEQERFLFRKISNPEEVKDLIMSLQKKFEDKEENEFGELIRKKVHHDDIE